ncbi:MAG: Gfo/Idh/MocA family oxidoreductase [Clostridia bacterium]|nr:Gfo/Idh/MocA family oxidoreductase [Clostridia bacterium]
MRIAIIGYGGMGNFHYEKAFARYNNTEPDELIECAGIYDISEERCEFARGLGLRVFGSAEEIFADRSIEAVVIATPNDIHLPYVLAAAKAGKHIIVEKPAGLGLDEVKRMYDAAEAAGVLFTPHQNRRWDDDYITVKELISKGSLGECYRIESRVMGANGIPGEWRKVAAQGGGMMLDWGVHLIDQMLGFIKEEVTSVYCTYSYRAGEEVDDGFALEVGFKSGKTYRVVVDTNSFVELPRWQLYCDDGTAVVTDWHNFKVEGRSVRCLVRKDDKLEGVSAGNGFTKTMARRRSETVEVLPLDVVRGDKTAFYRNFVEAVRGREALTIKRGEIERVFKLMELAKLSSDTREVIKESF